MVRKTTWRSVMAVACAVLCSAEPRAQTPPPVTYSAEVTLVEVDAVVTDGEGRPVRDLRKEDFEIFENGKRQAIDRLSFVEIPIARAQLRAAAFDTAPTPDVRTNLQRFEGRLYVLLLDDVQTSAPRAVRVKRAARRFIAENFEPGDIAAVVHVSGLGGANQDFTSDARLLLASIERFQGRKGTSETLNRIDEYNRLRQLKSNPMFGGVDPADVKDRDEAVRAHDARGAFEAIAGIGRRLAPVRGRRKALLWFGEGVSYDMFDLSRAQATSVLESARAAVAAATRANLVIYGVDARGLGGVGEEIAQISSPAVDPQMPFNAAALQQEMRRSQDHLRRISNESGGFAVVNTDEFARAFDRVVMENSTYYLLGYYPQESRGDASYRTIEVKVKRPGVSVRARAGYIPARPANDAGRRDEAERGVGSGAPAALRDALSSPVPQSGLPMAAHAAAFRGRGEKASVLVTVEYGAAGFETPAAGGSDGMSRDRLQASVIAVDPFGKVEASDHTSVGLDVKPETRQTMKVLGLRTHARLELRPGRYQLRLAGLLANGLVGSVHKDIEVPDFTASGAALSDLVLTSVVAGLVPTAQLDERMRQVLPAPPSATRDFRQDEAIALFVEAYEAGRAASRDVAFTTTVRGPGGKPVYTKSDTRTADQLKESNGGYSAQVPLRQLAPGDYVLRIEVTPSGAAQALVREAAFRVWAVPQSAVRNPQSAAGDPSIVVIARGAVSGVREMRQVLARRAEELQALWSSLPVRAAAPQVDFANTMVAALFLGTRPTAGYEVEVAGVRREGNALVISWREREPAPGNPAAETTPFAIVGVPMHAGEVRFERIP